MVRLLCRLRAAWRFASHVSWRECEPWRKDDARSLAYFFNTDSGKKLRAVLRDVCISQNAAALSQKEHLQFAAGFAMGQSALVTLLETLATADSISDADDKPGGEPNPSE